MTKLTRHDARGNAESAAQDGPGTPAPTSAPAAFETINRRFYSWGGILRRWARFEATYLSKGPPHGRALTVRLVRSVLLAAIYFKLSVFQRHHAREKVFVRR